MQHDHALKKLKFDPRVRGGLGWVCGQNICYHVTAFMIPFKFDMQHDHVLKKLEFVSSDPAGGGGGGLQAKYLLPCYCIHDSLYFDATGPCPEKVEI